MKVWAIFICMDIQIKVVGRCLIEVANQQQAAARSGRLPMAHKRPESGVSQCLLALSVVRNTSLTQSGRLGCRR